MGVGTSRTDGVKGPPGFRDALRSRTFAVLYGAESQSIVGDQLARVALAILVFRRTDSSAATALTYAATFLPAVVGGLALAGIGDRMSRRHVMIGCDLLRAALFASMAIPGLPIWALVSLLVVAVFVRPAFSASQVSYLAAALDPELFRVGTGLRMITSQGAQVVGFGLGGVLVAAVQPAGALLINAVTYLASAAVIAVALGTGGRGGRGRHSAGEARPAQPAGRARGGFATVWQDPTLKGMLALSGLAGLFVVAEGMAVPFGAEAGASTTQTGLLLAAIPLGSALGVLVLIRFVPKERRPRLAPWMAVLCGLPLVITAIAPSWPLAVGCWLLCGAFAAYQVEVMTSLVHLVPDDKRAGVVGVASSMLLGAQGLGLAAFSAVAEYLSAADSIGIAGLLGTAIALLVTLGPLREWSRRATEDASTDGRRSPATAVVDGKSRGLPDSIVDVVPAAPGRHRPDAVRR
jgi:predicted MFS family arabinose efflux permease